MLILRNKPVPPSSEITPRKVYEARRNLLVGAAAGLGLPALPLAVPTASAQRVGELKLKTTPSPLSSTEPPTAYRYVTSYNNYYEFGTDKDEPAVLAQKLRLRPWTVSVEGELLKPKVFDVDELLAMAALEERIYRLR
ncbi:MAG: protein-methionine-sulfoxide reductase catalytic subunit MsrP, partial [Quisquiliibacterium sp.]